MKIGALWALVSPKSQKSAVTVATFAAFLFAAAAYAGDIAVHSSGRYYQDASGKPMFLIGYYGWAAVPDGYYIDHPSRYSTMITQGAPYKINYIRISLGVNRFTGSTDPASWDGNPTPVPFLYVGGKADLDQWDPAFWTGLRTQCELARQNGVVVHISVFDGVELRGGSEAYRYANSFWNPANQARQFYSDPDKDHDGNIDENGDFYQLSAFNNNTDIGAYQRKLIDKVISETASYDNVFYELGNELLSAPSDWTTAVIGYVRQKTSKAVSQCGLDFAGRAGNLRGWSQHKADTPAQVKSYVASIVGLGFPAWEDPDGPALSDLNVSPDDLRRAAWYSFVGGAPCWGGFTVDFWDGGPGFNTTKATYYKNLQQFIQDSGVQFWSMTPRHTLVGNNSVNSCLAKAGSEYVAYILSDSSVTLDLSAVSGSIGYKLYNPKTGAWTEAQSVAGGGTRMFNKPTGADDWVIFVSSSILPSLVLDEPLTNGTTSGVRSGGTFITGVGWKVTGHYDSIYWHLSTITKGAAEFSVSGLVPGECRPEMSDKSELFHMYDYTYNNADSNYDGYRNNPYKHFVRKSGCLNGAKTDSCEILWRIRCNYDEGDSPVLSWDPSHTYLFRLEWGPDGSGNSYLKTYRDGTLKRRSKPAR